MFGRRRNGFLLLTIILVLATVVFLYGHSSRREKAFGPPQLTYDEERLLQRLHLKGHQANPVQVLEAVSSIVQSQLYRLQNVTDCENSLTLDCGHWDHCGVGCQIHHRIACLMTSYALNIPLIHDEERGWPYNQKWSDVFQPLGTHCKPGPNTYHLEWREWVGLMPLIFKRNDISKSLQFPLANGLPVPTRLAELVESSGVVDTWLWWLGQFLKYGLRLTSEVRNTIEYDKSTNGFNILRRPIIGFHVRRTDKKAEASDSGHTIAQYFEMATDFYEKMEMGIGMTKSVFIASDDHLVLREATNMFRPPEWHVVAFPSQETHRTPYERVDDFYTMIRDLIVLSECDFVVCGFSSNICRVILEMFGSRTTTLMNPWKHVKSLDGSYSYIIMGNVSERVVKY